MKSNQVMRYFDYEFAEPLYFFVLEMCQDYFEKSDELSMAEYVYQYRMSDFVRYLSDNGYIES